MEIEASDPAWDLDFDDWLDGIEIPTPRMAFNQTVEYLAGIHVEKDFDEVSNSIVTKDAHCFLSMLISSITFSFWTLHQ